MNIQRLIRSAIVGKNIKYWRSKENHAIRSTYDLSDEPDRYEMVEEKVIAVYLYLKKTHTWRDMEFTKGETWVIETESGVEIGIHFENDDFIISTP